MWEKKCAGALLWLLGVIWHRVLLGIWITPPGFSGVRWVYNCMGLMGLVVWLAGHGKRGYRLTTGLAKFSRLTQGDFLFLRSWCFSCRVLEWVVFCVTWVSLIARLLFVKGVFFADRFRELSNLNVCQICIRWGIFGFRFTLQFTYRRPHVSQDFMRLELNPRPGVLHVSSFLGKTSEAGICRSFKTWWFTSLIVLHIWGLHHGCQWRRF